MTDVTHLNTSRHTFEHVTSQGALLAAVYKRVTSHTHEPHHTHMSETYRVSERVMMHI